jgi:hypothetical protein
MKYLIFLLFLSCATTQHHKPEFTKYNRKDWPHWLDKDKDCLDTRAEILKLRSISKVTTNKKGCKIISGRWIDYYYPESHYFAKNVDIDHLIPLKHAHDNGGALWTKQQKEIFANDPENLVITNKTYNRKKGAKGIDAWLPVHKDYACRYISDWIKLKTKYRLKFTATENNTINTLGCP